MTPQYEGLEALYRDDQGRGLEILGFPCHQFKEQEPGTDAEIQDFCKATYNVTFPVFSKVDVNGPDADPLYAYLRARRPATSARTTATSTRPSRRSGLARTAPTRSSGTSPSSSSAATAP